MKGEISNMSDVADSTNVDNGKKDKYLKDIENGVPNVNGVCEYVTDGPQVQIVVDGRKGVVVQKGNSLLNGAVEIPVYSEPIPDLKIRKEKLKQRQASQEEKLFGGRTTDNLEKEVELSNSETEK